MTKKHFEHAASIVRNILAGDWSFDSPDWTDDERFDSGIYDDETERAARYTVAVNTAQAFILLATAFNPRFDEKRFLIACGLIEPPKKGKR